MGAPPPPPAGTGRRLVAVAALVVAHVVAAALLVAAAIQAALSRRAPARRRASGVVFRATETAAVDTVIRPLVRAHGADTVAHASANGPEFSHYVVPGAGSIAFAVAAGAGRRVPMALGDPLAPRAAWPAVVDGFLADVAERDCGVPREQATFWHASPAFAAWLAGRYAFLRADPFGAETRLDARSWAHTARTRTLRRDARQARDAGVVVYEASAADLDAPGARAALAALSAAWRAGKAVSDRPLRAFCRSPDWATLRLGDDAGDRLFVAVLAKGGAQGARPAITAASLAGVVLLDPLWSAGAVTGYFPTLNQMAPWAHQGTLKAAYECVLAALKQEGVATLNLGFAPAFAVGSASARLPTTRPTAWAGPLAAAAYAHGNALYAFTALAASKTRWAGASFDAARGAFGPKAGAALTHVYIVHGRAAPTPLAAVDLMLCLRWLGFWDTLAGAVGQVVGVDFPKWLLAFGAAAPADEKEHPAPAPAPAPVPAAKAGKAAPPPPAAAAALARVSPFSVLDAPPSRPTTPYEAAAAVAAAVPSPFAAAAAQAAAGAKKPRARAERLSPVSSLFAAPSFESTPSTPAMERALSPPLEPGTPPALAAAAAAAVVGAREA